MGTGARVKPSASNDRPTKKRTRTALLARQDEAHGTPTPAERARMLAQLQRTRSSPGGGPSNGFWIDQKRGMTVADVLELADQLRRH